MGAPGGQRERPRLGPGVGGWPEQSARCWADPPWHLRSPVLVLPWDFPANKATGHQYLAWVRPGPQASSFSPLPARSRDPAAASVKDIPEVSGVSSNPGHGDQAPLHDLPGELACAGGRGAARTTWGVSSPGAGRTASSDRSGTIEC